MDLSFDNLVATLRAASDVAQEGIQKNAEAQLKAWEITRGYHFLLQQVYNDQTQSLQIRWLAVICLKNGIDKHWRKTRVHCICPEEKEEIRRNLFSQLDESNNRLAMQNAYTVARISRYDFPAEWPTIFDEMTDILEKGYSSDNAVRINNLLIILNQVLKVLGAVRIGRARSAVQTKLPVLVPHLIKYYHHYYHMWADEGTAFDAGIMEVGYMCLKTIRRAVVEGYEAPHKDPAINEFFSSTLLHFQRLLILHESSELQLLERYLKCYLKLYFNMASSNTASFLLFGCSKDIILTLLSMLQQKAEAVYNVEERDGSDFWEQMAVKSMHLLKKVTDFACHQGARTILHASDKAETEKAVKMVKDGIFTQSLVCNLANMLIESYLKLRPCDLDAWQDEPEEWVTEEGQATWGYQLRACAGNYFRDLTENFKGYLTEMLLARIQSTLSDASVDVLTKDSVLSVFQLSSHAIAGSCNFDDMFPSYFLPEALKGDKIIERRICLIASEWVGIQCNDDTRDQIYKLVATLLQPSADKVAKVVQLTAAETLRTMLQDWEFRKLKFRPYLDSTMESLLALLQELSFTESKMLLLQVLSLVIEHNGQMLDENALGSLVAMVPQMWQQSNDSNELILKNSLLRILKDLTNSLGTQSLALYPMVLPLIPLCCTEGSQYYSLLCEDGFELWAAVLRQMDTQKPVPPVVYGEWFPLILKGLCNWTEILPLVLSIVRSYTLLDASLFETDLGLQIFKVLGGYYASMRDDSLAISSQIVELLVVQQQQRKSPKLIEMLTTSGLFNAMVVYITKETETPVTEIKTALPILRLVVLDSRSFVFDCLASIVVKGTSLSLLFYRLVQNLLLFLRITYDAKTRKLLLMALLSLYDPAYFDHRIEMDPAAGGDIEYQLQNSSDADGIALTLSLNFNKVLTLAAQFLEEVQESPDGDCKSYHQQSPYDDEELVLVQTDEELREEGDDPDNEYVEEFRQPDSAERVRFTQLELAEDPIYNVNLKQFIKFKITQLAGGVGNYEGLLNTIPEATMNDLELSMARQ